MTQFEFKLTKTQYKVLTTSASEIFWGGSAGGGKSMGLRLISTLLCLEIPDFQAFLFRRKRPDLIRSHLRGPHSYQAILKPFIDRGMVKIVKDEIRFLFNNSVIHLCHCNHDDDIKNYLSSEMYGLFIDEVSAFTPDMYKFLRSRSRIPKSLYIPEKWKGKIPFIMLASNPSGEFNDYALESFIAPAPLGNVEFQAKSDDGSRTRIYIPSRATDNPHIDAQEYIKSLEGLGSEELIRMYRDGDFTVVLGSYFKTFTRDHIIRPITLPDHWTRFRAIDWGYDHPHTCLWFAVSDGTIEGIEDEALVVYREQHDSEIVARDAGKIITERTGSEIIRYTVLDPAAFNKRSDVVKDKTIAQELVKGGVYCQPADNSRVAGWQQLHWRFKYDKIKIFSDCVNLIKCIPRAQHADLDREDVAKFNGDDPLDALRYGAMSYMIVKRQEPNKISIKSFSDYSYNDLHSIVLE